MRLRLGWVAERSAMLSILFIPFVSFNKIYVFNLNSFARFCDFRVNFPAVIFPTLKEEEEEKNLIIIIIIHSFE